MQSLEKEAAVAVQYLSTISKEVEAKFEEFLPSEKERPCRLHIRVTSAVMAAPEVHASKVAELEYSATFAPDRSRAGWFQFEGKCLNSAAKGAPECHWT